MWMWMDDDVGGNFFELDSKKRFLIVCFKAYVIKLFLSDLFEIHLTKNYCNLGKFIYFHGMIHVEHNPIISLLMILFQKMVLCQDSIWKLKTACNLSRMRSTKVNRNTFRIIFSKPINEELLKFHLIFTNYPNSFCVQKKWCSDSNLSVLIVSTAFLLFRSVCLILKVVYKSKIISIFA